MDAPLPTGSSRRLSTALALQEFRPCVYSGDFEAFSLDLSAETIQIVVNHEVLRVKQTSPTRDARNPPRYI